MPFPSYPPEGPTIAPETGSGGLTPNGKRTHANTKQKGPTHFKMAYVHVAMLTGDKLGFTEVVLRGPHLRYPPADPSIFHNLHMCPPGFTQLVHRGPQPRYPPAAPGGCYNLLSSALPPRSPGQVLSQATCNAGRQENCGHTRTGF